MPRPDDPLYAVYVQFERFRRPIQQGTQRQSFSWMHQNCTTRVLGRRQPAVRLPPVAFRRIAQACPRAESTGVSGTAFNQWRTGTKWIASSSPGHGARRWKDAVQKTYFRGDQYASLLTTSPPSTVPRARQIMPSIELFMNRDELLEPGESSPDASLFLLGSIGEHRLVRFTRICPCAGERVQATIQARRKISPLSSSEALLF